MAAFVPTSLGVPVGRLQVGVLGSTFRVAIIWGTKASNILHGLTGKTGASEYATIRPRSKEQHGVQKQKMWMKKKDKNKQSKIREGVEEMV